MSFEQTQKSEGLTKRGKVTADSSIRWSCVRDRVGCAGLLAGQEPPGERPRPGL